MINKQIVLASRPEREAHPGNFHLVETPLADPADGQVLVRNHYLSLDPYMRMRMSDAKSYAAPQVLGEVMVGGTAGVVVASRHDKYEPGDNVVAMGGWQQYTLFDAGRPGTLRKVDASKVPLSAYLGAVGMPGVTAWYGLTRVIAAKAGETLTVSAASGAVGGVVGQLAKLRGLRAVGIAGGPEKCAYVKEELGFDACVDHRAHADAQSLARALRAACPNGIDGVFENVGGAVLDAELRLMNAFGRITICGLISQYNATEPYGIRNLRSVLTDRIRMQGFIVSDRMELWPRALADLGQWVADGKIKYRESIAHGLESAPQAFLGMLRGENFGKQVVKLT